MRRARYILALVGAILLAGCGGSESTTTAFSTTERSVAPYSQNPLFYQQWYFDKDDSFYAQYGIDNDAHIHPLATAQYAGRGVKVVIIDDALDIYHEDIREGVVGVYDTQSGAIYVEPTDSTENHGTEVTGVLAATSNSLGITGVAPAAQIYFIRLPFNANLTESMIIDAFRQAKEWGADIVNCSWGSGDVSDALKATIQDLAINGRGGKGTVIVFAAGNGGYDAVGDPMGNDESAIPEVIGVGATNIYNERAKYSNYGPELDIMAPGGEYLGIATTDRMGSAGNDPGNYLPSDSAQAFAGTSAAAPIVSGVAALLLEADSNLTRVDVMRILESSADKIDSANCNYDANGHSIYCGYGKVNITNALSAI